MSIDKRKQDLYEEQELLEISEYTPDDYMPAPLYKNDEWLNEIDEDWINEWEDEYQ
jgi:hypothetical protein